MSITDGNPIIITSGQLSSPITRTTLYIDTIQWHQPTLDSTSGVLIRKENGAGPVLLHMRVEATSGETQVIRLEKARWKNPWVECMPTGTLYIHTK